MRWLGLVFLAACGGSGEPEWASATIALQVRDAVVDGAITWERYSGRWGGEVGGRGLVCTATFPLHGEATADCADCTSAWSVRLGPVQGDCEAAAVDDLPALAGVGLGPLVAELGAPDGTGQDGGYVVYEGDGWLAHGWARPGAAADGGAAIWTLEPAWAWTQTPSPR